MKKLVSSLVFVTAASVGVGACSGGNGTPFCDKARELTKSLGANTDISKEEAVKAVLAYKFMADNIPKDLKDVTKKDIDDLALCCKPPISMTTLRPSLAKSTRIA